MSLSLLLGETAFVFGQKSEQFLFFVHRKVLVEINTFQVRAQQRTGNRETVLDSADNVPIVFRLHRLDFCF